MIAGQLANVSAVLVLPAGAANVEKPLLDLLTRLFEDAAVLGDAAQCEQLRAKRVVVRGESKAGHAAEVGDLVRALESAREERVLLVGQGKGATADLMLGLTAWPEHECVAPRGAGADYAMCALYQRAPALAAAREELLVEKPSLAGVVGRLDSDFLAGDDLDALLAS